MLAVLVALVAAGCADGHPSGTSPPLRTGTAALPPDNVAALAPLLDPLVRPLGLRITRGALVDRETGAPGPAARHLELYVTPVVAFTDDRFVQTIVPLARELTPHIFQRWPGVESYDICQELSGVDGAPEAETQTVFDVRRGYALATDWSRVALAGLVADFRGGRDIRVEVTARLQPALDVAVR